MKFTSLFFTASASILEIHLKDTKKRRKTETNELENSHFYSYFCPG